MKHHLYFGLAAVAVLSISEMAYAQLGILGAQCTVRDGLGARPSPNCQTRTLADGTSTNVFDSTESPLDEIHDIPDVLFPPNGEVDVAEWRLNTEMSSNFVDAPRKLRQNLSHVDNVLVREVYDASAYGSEEGLIAAWTSTISRTEEGLQIDSKKATVNYDSIDPNFTNNRVMIQVRADGRLAIRFTRRNAETKKYEEVAKYVYNRAPEYYTFTEGKDYRLPQPTADLLRVSRVSDYAPSGATPPAGMVANATSRTGVTIHIRHKK